MRVFFVLALGRSGTAFLSSLLARDPAALVHHEADPMDPKLLSLRYAAHFGRVLDGLLEERFERLLSEAEARGVSIYGEVNSYLRYETAWLRQRFDPALVHLVRDGRSFVRSAWERRVYSPWEDHIPVVPADDDPYADRWAAMSRFERICWYWQHTNEMLARDLGDAVQLERLLQDYEYLEEKVLAPTGVTCSRESWRRQVESPRNTTGQNRRRRMLRRLVLRRPADQEMPSLPPWSQWSVDQTQRFWEICGSTMEKMGYGQS